MHVYKLTTRNFGVKSAGAVGRIHFEGCGGAGGTFRLRNSGDRTVCCGALADPEKAVAGLDLLEMDWRTGTCGDDDEWEFGDGTWR